MRLAALYFKELPRTLSVGGILVRAATPCAPNVHWGTIVTSNRCLSASCLLSVSCLASAAALLSAAWFEPASAQSSSESVPLPPVTVEASGPKKQAKKVATKKTAPVSAQQSPTPQAQAPSPTASPYQNATGPANGYVATDSASATKTGTPLIETPQTVNVVTSDQMEAQGITSVSAALRYTPGVVTEYRPTSRYDSMFIRGFGGGGNNANYVSFWDGLRIPKGLSYAIPTIDPYFLDRIEVVKGPSSVLYGQISPGGFVNLVSKKPTDLSFGEVETVVGSNNHFQTNFDFGGAVDNSGTVSYRLTGLYREMDSEVDYAESERFAIAPEFTFRGTDTTLTVQAYYQNEPEGGYYNSLPALGTIVPYAAGKIPSNFNVGEPSYDAFDREQFSAAYFLEHRIDETFTLRQNLRYTHVDMLFQAVSPNSYSPAGSSVIARNRTKSVEDFDAITVDNQAEAKFSTGLARHTVLAGVDYYYRDANRLLGTANLPAGNTINFNNPVYGQTITDPPLQATSQTISQTGLYLQDQVKIDNFVFVLGGRYDWSDIDTDNISAGTKSAASDEAFSWRTALLYHFDNGLAPYASYATSFEPTTNLGPGNTPLDPVEGEQFEVGLKYQPPGTNNFVTLSWFDITQTNVLTSAGMGVFSQIGEVTSTGVELEAKLELLPHLNVIGGYAYTDAEIVEDSNPAIVGRTPASVPEHMASLWADYQFTSGGLAGLGLGAGVRYIGETYANNQNRFQVAGQVVPATVDAFTLVDAAARFDLSYLNVPELKGWELSVNASNLFDKEFVAGCLPAGPAGTQTVAQVLNSTQCWYGDGRLVLGSLKYTW